MVPFPMTLNERDAYSNGRNRSKVDFYFSRVLHRTKQDGQDTTDGHMEVNNDDHDLSDKLGGQR